MNRIEDYKREKDGLDIRPDILRYSRDSAEGITERDKALMKWYGVFFRKHTPGFFMMRIRITNGIATLAQVRTLAEITEQLIVTVVGPETTPRVLLNQEEIPGAVDGVKDRIAELMKGRREKVVFFQAANELPYLYIVRVMDEIKGGGAEKIGLITDENLGLSGAPAGGQ